MSSTTNPDRHETSPVIVAITASAALPASLETLLRLVPPQENAALVVVFQNLEAFDGDRFRQAAQEGGHDPVMIEDALPVEAGRLYLNPPDTIVTIQDGRFHAHPTGQALGLQGVIDSFLLALARTAGDRAISVALEGTDGDGTLGAQQLKIAGGMVLAECIPEDLAASSSPAALADVVLPVEEIAWRLVPLIAQAARGPRDIAPPEADSPEAREALAAIAALLRQKTAHDFHGYKTGTFLRRVQRRMQALLLKDMAAYIELLRASTDEAQNLFNDLLIGVTEFFRDGREWELLEREVIPRLFQGKSAAAPVRAWVVGCSTGEEAYSLAMLLAEHRATLENPPPVQIFASDLDGRALAVARAGRYADSIAAQLTPERLGRWFVREGDTYCVAKALREMCIFSQHSLIKDAPFSRLDLVSCRNLLIYLDADLQEKVIPLFHFALNPGGFLFLGNSENASRHQNLFAPVEPRSRLFRRLDTAGRVLPTLPFTSVEHRWIARPLRAGPAEPAPETRDLTRWAEHAMERHRPAFVVLDRDHTVLHFSGPMGRYLAPASGAASLDLLQLVHPVLRAELRAALARAADTAQAAEAPGLEIRTDGLCLRVDLIVEPRLDPDSQPGFLVIFRNCGTRDRPGPEGAAGASGQDEHLRRLDDELRLTRDRLQATIEELESTNEELKSSNEEYQSLNEELQSANEELETSKEELQSVNEELTTVNGELAHRVQELGRANSDLKNFLESTQIATLFLDNDLRVTNFTPAIGVVFHLVEADEGRPIAHIKARVGYDELAEDARGVLRTLRPVEREIDNPVSGARYIARVLPYRSTDNFIAGVVVTFVDVTARKDAEAALRASEERFRAIVETAQDYAIFTTDAEGRIETWPAGAQKVFGWTAEQAVGQPVDITFTPEDREAGVPSEELREARETGQAPDVRWHQRKDGSRVFIEGMVRPLTGVGQAPPGFLKVGQNVTERQTTEAALRKSEERFRQFGEAVQDVLWIRDAETMQWEYLTPAFETIYGVPREEALRGDNFRNWLEMILPEDRAHALENATRVREGERRTFEYRIRSPADGRVRWLRDTDFPMRDETGRVVRIGGIGQDITELKAAEAALAAAEQRQRALLEGIPQLVWRAVDGGEWTWASPQWTAYTGKSETDSLGLGWREALHPEDRDGAMRLWEAAAESGRLEMEGRIFCAAEQGYRWFQTRAAPVRDESGAIVEWLGTSTEIDELRGLQERQKVLVAELQHRTRNLMTVIRSLADKTARTSVDLADFRARFRDRLEALARVQGLLSRLEGDGRVTFDVLIGTELSALGASAERVTLAGPRGVRLRSSTVQTLAMALHELATNAVKYGALGQPQGRLSVKWSLDPAPDGSPWLHIDWRESGIAMPRGNLRPEGGQGRELIERALPYQLDAQTAYALEPDGVHCTISIPVSTSTLLQQEDA